MDYSSLPNDPAYPPGTSPWQSSPRPANGPSYTESEASSTASSPRAHHSSTANSSHDQRPEDDSDQDTLKPGRDQHDETLESSVDSAPDGPANHVQKNQKAVEQNLHPSYNPQDLPKPPNQQGQQQRGSGPNRYRGTNRSDQRAHLPQYKLQAKVTGLERTGRKDPVLRFDVHVSCVSSIYIAAADKRPRPTFLNFAPPNSEMFGALTPNLPNSLTTSYHPILKHWSLRYLHL